MRGDYFISCCPPYFTKYTLLEINGFNEKVESNDKRGTTIIEAKLGYFRSILELDEFYKQQKQLQTLKQL